MNFNKKLESLEFIEDDLKRNITFCKRKKGILKKVTELCHLCDQDISLFIWDK